MAGLLSAATREQIRAANDIVEVIGTYVPLKRAGANWVGLCPFHREKTPSFNVNPQRQIFHCFGCHKGGDVFTFVQDFENIGFLDAVRRLAERARIPLEFEQGEAAQQSRHLKDQLLAVHEQIAARWHTLLLNDAAGEPARQYLLQRGVSEEAVRLFRLGYAPEAWDDTVNWARAKGHDLALVEQGGLIIRRESGEGFYDRFRGRLMFPISDEQGRVIGFSGRLVKPAENVGKYINSPETPIFFKSRVFFGLDKSRKAILDAGFAIVCEGQLDLIACYTAGARNIVAPQGTAFTAEHARILRRYTSEVVLCFDSDDAGQNAAVRSLDSLLGSGLAVRVAVVPAPHDPDSFIKEQGGAAFQALIAKAQGFFDYYLARLCQRHEPDTDRGRLAILKEFGSAALKTQNAVLLDACAQKAALRLAVAPDAVRSEFKKLAEAERRAAPAPAEDKLAAGPEPELAGRPPPPPPEMWLLRLLFGHDEFVPLALQTFDPRWLQHEDARRLVEARLRAEATHAWHGAADFLSEIEDDHLRRLLSEALMDTREIPDPEKQLHDLLWRLRNLALDRQLTQLIHDAALPETDEARQVELLRQQQELRRLKAAPLALLRAE